MALRRPLRVNVVLQPAPVAVFAYNRPQHLRQAIDSLRGNALAARTDLHVFSDGPANDIQRQPVQEVRRYARAIDGFSSVVVHEAPDNAGLAASVIKGVDQLCRDYGHVIVVEDDLVVSPHFLAYMNEALQRYRDDKRVMQISGHMFPVKPGNYADALFLPFTTSWGWASWARAWEKFDPTASGFQSLVHDRQRRHRFNMNGAYDYYSMLGSQLRGRIDSWAIRWNLSVFMHDGLVLYPRRTLVQNRGFDGSGVHCRGDAPNGEIDPDFQPRQFPLVQLDDDTFTEIADYFRARNGIAGKLRELKARLFG